MDNQIKISLEEVKEAAGQLKSINFQMNDILMSCKQEMSSLASIWQSKGSDEIRQRFENFSLKFEELKETIDQYARFLDMSASSYENVETTIHTNASNFN